MHRILFAACSLAIVCAAAHAQQALSLHDAVRNGLAKSPESYQSSDRLAVEQAAVVQAKVRPNPRMYLQSEDLRPWNNSFSFANDTEDYGYIGQTLELAGKRGKRIAYAQDNVRRSEEVSALDHRDIVAGIAEAYWAAAAAQQAAQAWQQQVADFDRIVQYQSDRVHSGATAGVDLLRTQVERDRIAIESAQAARDAEVAMLQLARKSATQINRTTTLTDSLEQERPVAEVQLQIALEQRPDVAIAQAAVRQAASDLKLQKANGVPDLDLFAGYKRDTGANTMYASLQWDLPIFNRNQGGTAAARAQQQLAEDTLDYTRMTASTEVLSASASYKTDQSLVRDTLPPMQERSEKNAAIIADAYRSGGTDLLRFLDAERVLLETRLLAIHAWQEYQHAVISLQLAYGEEP